MKEYKNDIFELKKPSCFVNPDSLKIRGKEANWEDFVEIDCSRGNWSCNNISVTPINRVTRVLSTLKKYDLSPEDMEKIQDTLCEMLDGRSCGLCS